MTFKFQRIAPLLTICLSLTLVACNDAPERDAQTQLPPMVKMMPIESAQTTTTRLSGSIEARRQNPLSFQISGRIQTRLVNAGDRVAAGQPLFILDSRDLEQAEVGARAQVQAANRALETANDELARANRLFKSNFVSQQALDQGALRVAEAQSRLDLANSNLTQASNALGYASLSAPADGIVTEVSAEVGQVVSPGQAVGQFAYQGQLEIEVFLPQGLMAPQTAVVAINDQQWPATLREVSGAADPRSRTFRARYTLPDNATEIAIGTIADLLLPSLAGANLARVPLGAIDERGEGPQVWLVVDGLTRNVPVTLLSMSRESAQIQTDLPIGTPVVATGTHLLEADMRVRVQGQ